jgi:hypothetical protein
MSGELQVTSRPGGGIAVSVGVPLAPDRAEAASVYLRRTLWWGLVLVVTSARLVWDMAHTAAVSPSTAAVVALSTLVFGRELYAWIRLRRKVEVRS